MPYTIRKQKCKQSDGDRGNHVLSYTDSKGKKHRNCHTSRKNAEDQIKAIEAESVNKDTKMKITILELRNIIRQAIKEAYEADVKEYGTMAEKDMEESEFTYAIAKAAEKGEKTVDIDGEKFPVKMSKEKAKDIVKNEKK